MLTGRPAPHPTLIHQPINLLAPLQSIKTMLATVSPKLIVLSPLENLIGDNRLRTPSVVKMIIARCDEFQRDYGAATMLVSDLPGIWWPGLDREIAIDADGKATLTQ